MRQKNTFNRSRRLLNPPKLSSEIPKVHGSCASPGVPSAAASDRGHLRSIADVLGVDGPATDGSLDRDDRVQPRTARDAHCGPYAPCLGGKAHLAKAGALLQLHVKAAARQHEEQERLEAEQRQRDEKERAEQREKERLEKQRLETEQREKQRLEAEQREKERLEAEERRSEAKERIDAEQGAWCSAQTGRS